MRPPKSSIVVIDNGAGTIKAGFAGEHRPRVTTPNCALLPFRPGASAEAAPVTGDDVYLIPEAFCLRPFQSSLLLDSALESSIWQKVLSSSRVVSGGLNVNPEECSLLVTEPFGTPSTIRQTLSQLVFEELGFRKLVISPSEQLIPVAFANASPDVQYAAVHGVQSLSVSRTQSPNNARRTLGSNGSPSPSACTTPLARNSNDQKASITVYGDDCFGGVASRHHFVNEMAGPSAVDGSSSALKSVAFRLKQAAPAAGLKHGADFLPPHAFPSSFAPESYSQLIVDVGHFTSRIVPLYGEVPIEPAVRRLHLGGFHGTALLKNLLGYRQLNCERTELMVQHIKERSSIVSLNYRRDLELLREAGERMSHLFEEILLPNYNNPDRNAVKLYFKEFPPVALPTYRPVLKTNTFHNKIKLGSRRECLVCNADKDRPSLELATGMDEDLLRGVTLCFDCFAARDGVDFEPDSQRSESAQVAADLREMFGNSPRSTGPAIGGGNNATSSEIGSVKLTVERIAPAEVFFSPSDYNFGEKVGAQTATTTAGVPNLSSVMLPEKQPSLPEAIAQAVYASPPVLQPLLTRKIYLAGGPTKSPNFPLRLYRELRGIFPQSWPVNVYHLSNPGEATWLGASQWTAEGDNFSTFCVSRAQYFEAGTTKAHQALAATAVGD